MRGEIQELLHQTFNLLESARREMFAEASRDVPREEEQFLRRMSELLGMLGSTYEQLRARVLPIVG